MKNYFKEENEILPEGVCISLDFCIYSIKDLKYDIAHLNSMIYGENDEDITVKNIKKINDRLLKDKISNHFYHSIITNLLDFHQTYKYKRKKYMDMDVRDIEKKYNSIENDVILVKKFVKEVLEDIDNLRI